MTDLKQLFLDQTPLLDVRAPVEFNKGAFPSATNLPILDDENRHLVGTCYKEQGAAAAEHLGYELVQSQRDTLIQQWQTFLRANPNALVYCFRGGKRSQIAAQWLTDAGTPVTRVDGGYKRLRSYLIEQLDSPPDIILLSGKTGVGKTDLLPQIKHAVDLEGLANHRGSAFGGQLSPQPSQIDFENRLAIEFLRHPDYVVLEDESRLIGRIHIPQSLQDRMKEAPIWLLEDSVENRSNRILKEYVLDPLAHMPIGQLQHRLEESLNAIQKRLGGVRFQAMKTALANAFSAHQGGDPSQHLAWIEALLVDYYDPMYEYQLDKKEGRIQHKINWANLTNQELDFRSDCS